MGDKYPNEEIKKACIDHEIDRIQNVMPAIIEERRYQIERWGIEEDDRRNMPNDFITYISHYATRWFTGEFPPYKASTYQDFRTCMIKVATIALAAVAWCDRRAEMNPGKRKY